MRVTFFRVAERKSPKKGRPCCLRPLRCAAGQPGVLGHGVHRRTHCAPAALRSDNCGESVHDACVSFGTHATPRPARPRRIQKGTHRDRTSIRAVAALGPTCAARGACARETRPSEAMARVAVRLLEVRLSTPCWLRLRRGGCGVSMGVAAPMLRALARRGCPSGAAQQQSEFHGAPRNRPDAGLPRSEAKGSQTGGRLFFGDFLLATQKKVTRMPGDSRPPPSTKAHGTFSSRLRQAQPERPRETQTL